MIWYECLINVRETLNVYTEGLTKDAHCSLFHKQTNYNIRIAKIIQKLLVSVNIIDDSKIIF